MRAIAYNVDNTIQLPARISTYCFGKYVVLIDGPNCNWLVCDIPQYQLFAAISSGLTIRQAMTKFQEEQKLPDDSVILQMKQLLQNIERNRFYPDFRADEPVQFKDIVPQFHINLTNNCNLRCKHCFASAGYRLIGEKPASFWHQILERISQIHTPFNLVVSGGEPMMYGDSLISILQEAAKLGGNVTLFTNGTRVSEGFLDAAGTSISNAQLSMEAATETTFDAVRGKGSFAKFTRGLKSFQERKIPVTLAVTVLDSTLDDLERSLEDFVIRYCNEMTTFRFNDEVEELGNAGSLINQNFDFDLCRALRVALLANRIAATLGSNETESSKRGIVYTNCGIGCNYVFAPDGSVMPCSYSGQLQGFSPANDLVSAMGIYAQLNDQTSVSEMRQCSACDIKYICGGGCRLRHLATNGDMTSPDCTLRFKREKVARLIVQEALQAEGVFAC